MCIGFFSPHTVIEVYTIEFDTPSSCASMASLARMPIDPTGGEGCLRVAREGLERNTYILNIYSLKTYWNMV